MNYRKVPFMPTMHGLAGYDALSPGNFMGAVTAPAAKPVKVTLRASTTLAPGFPGFLAWLAGAHPNLYNVIKVQYPNLSLYTQYGNPGTLLGQDTSLSPINVTATMLPAYQPAATPASGGFFSDLASSLATLAPTVLATVDQQNIFNAQLSRAKAGLPPLNTSSYGLPSMQGAVNTLMLPVIVIGGLVAFLIFRRKR